MRDSVKHAIHEPGLTIVQGLGNSIRRTVAQRHVPFVAVPPLFPPIARRPPGTIAPFDTAATESAAIGRHPRRPPLLDGHARWYRRAEAPQHTRRRLEHWQFAVGEWRVMG